MEHFWCYPTYCENRQVDNKTYWKLQGFFLVTSNSYRCPNDAEVKNICSILKGNTCKLVHMLWV